MEGRGADLGGSQLLACQSQHVTVEMVVSVKLVSLY